MFVNLCLSFLKWKFVSNIVHDFLGNHLLFIENNSIYCSFEKTIVDKSRGKKRN